MLFSWERKDSSTTPLSFCERALTPGLPRRNEIADDMNSLAWNSLFIESSTTVQPAIKEKWKTILIEQYNVM